MSARAAHRRGAPLARWRAARLRREADAAEARFAAERHAADDDLDAAQLARFNAAWAQSLRRSPWARRWRDQTGLPTRFGSWDEIAASAPIQRKADLRALFSAPQSDEPGATERATWRATGGATAEPLRFPMFGEEPRIAARDHWTARRRLGVDPGDRLFLLWGHAHLFGTGWRGAAARWRRIAADQALGYTRWSAYDLSDEALRAGGAALLRSGAAYVIGYSGALDRFARANAAAAEAIRALELKAVIATAEAFPRPESRARIEALFGCPVAMEYGAMETGPLAHEPPRREADGAPAGGFEVFARHHRLELGPELAPGGARELLVTSLYPRAAPLIRYAIGDAVRPTAEGMDAAAQGGLARLDGLIGRSNDAVLTAAGAPLHSEALTHALRDLPDLAAFQILRGPDGRARRLRYEAPAPLPDAARDALRARLGRLDPALGETPLERVDSLSVSPAGKRPMVIDEACATPRQAATAGA
ncbi:MAG: hypothetical protein AAGM38_04180 [Pseudomonadota bacterium]